MFEYSRHFPGSRRHSCDRHDRVSIDLEHFVGAIVDDGTTGRCAAISGDEDAPLKLEGQNCRSLRWNQRRFRDGSEACLRWDWREKATPAEEARKIIDRSR